MIPQTASDWEALWAPYDDETYSAALAALTPDDIVLDIGAGDLRFARRAARRVKHVIAIERRAELLTGDVPNNMRVVCGDARRIEFPATVTTAVLLMRHCQHFALYREKLERSGCERLITNARWRMDVEVIDLRAPRLAFSEYDGGWYACACGGVGYKTGLDATECTRQVRMCPHCSGN